MSPTPPPPPPPPPPLPASPGPGRRLALQADLLDFTADPGLDERASRALRWRPAHWLLIGDDGRIAAIRPDEPGDDWPKARHPGRLLLPGFIDTHVHMPQVDVIASWGTELLDWLTTYTFPAEARLADPAQARLRAELFCDALLAEGTTTPVAFATVHAASAQALFQALQARGMCGITGKVLMDRHAPDTLRDDVAQSQLDNEALIQRWHRQGRLHYAVTPRFAATSSPQQMAMAAGLLQRHPGLYMQTHVAENQAEVAWIAELFPQARSYLAVYDDAGLLNERAVLAHGIWLDDADRRLLADRGAQIAHSPTSNLFLGSGLIGWRALADAGVAVSLASDVGGGTSLSMLKTLAAAYQVQALAGQRLSAWALLHAATRGAAQALRLGSQIGQLEPGLQADLVLWDWARGPVAEHRDSLARAAAQAQAGDDAAAIARGLHERVFAWLMLGDDRNRLCTWVAGRAWHDRRGTAPAG